MAAYGFCLQHLRNTGKDWRSFVLGSELLLGHHRGGSQLTGGLHLYANYPTLQIGPLSFLAATPLRLLGGSDGRVASALLMTAVAPGLVFVIERSARRVWPRTQDKESWLPATILLGGLMVVQAWSPLGTIYMHLDDALTITAGVVAVWGVAARRPVTVGVAIALAGAAKPWGVILIPLAFALAGRARWKALGLALVGIAVAWAPFVLADSGTLDAIRPRVLVDPASVLHLVGVPIGYGPDWTRPVQLGVALVLGVLAVIRGRWPAVLLVGIAARLALDPGVFLYYASGLVVAAFVWDALQPRRRLPLATLFTFVLLNDSYILFDDPTTRAALRLTLSLVLVASMLLAPRADRSSQNRLDVPL
jgi:hypothetical protein